MISSKKIDIIAVLLIALVLVGIVCAMFAEKSNSDKKRSNTYAYSDLHKVTVTDNDYYIGYDEKKSVKIELNGTSAESSSNNVEIDGGDIIIRAGGIYVISGTLDNGTVTVDNSDGAEVVLIFNGVNITSSDFSALYIKQSEKTVISLVPETENCLTDGDSYSEDKQQDGKPSAALYSKDNVVINGSGSLTVNGNHKDGIKANDNLIITEGNITIIAAEDGVDVNDYVAFIGASINVKAGNDCIKCKNDDEKQGFIAVENSNFTLVGDGDGMSASTAVYLNEVTADITTGGGSENAAQKQSGFGFFGINNHEEKEKSTKGIKAGTNICINGGAFTVDSCDDAIHSDNDVTIEGGTFEISSGDDAIHSDLNLVLNPEKINIEKCYEGLEGAYVTINGGEISIISQDDGINATGENSVGMGMPCMHTEEVKAEEDDIWLTVNGGHIYIETSGDGFDSNGSALINGGFLEIYGPEDNGNGSVDVGDGGYVFIINGGEMLAAGSSGMAENPSELSSQRSVSFYLDEYYPSGSKISLKDDNGNDVIMGTSNKKFNWVSISTENITEGVSYTLVVDNDTVMSVTSDAIISTAGSNIKGRLPGGERSRIQR